MYYGPVLCSESLVFLPFRSSYQCSASFTDRDRLSVRAPVNSFCHQAQAFTLQRCFFVLRWSEPMYLPSHNLACSLFSLGNLFPASDHLHLMCKVFCCRPQDKCWVHHFSSVRHNLAGRRRGVHGILFRRRRREAVEPRERWARGGHRRSRHEGGQRRLPPFWPLSRHHVVRLIVWFDDFLCWNNSGGLVCVPTWMILWHEIYPLWIHIFAF